MTFEKGDIVQVDYKSTKLIEEWMSGLRKVGPGDVGVVKYSVLHALPKESGYSSYLDTVTVTFPLLGTFGVLARDLKILQKRGDHVEGG